MAKRGTVALLLGLGTLIPCVHPVTAAGWRKAVNTGPESAQWMRLADDGTIRKHYANDRVGVAQLGWSASRWRRCPVPGVHEAPPKYRGVWWDANPGGAMAAGWRYGPDALTAPRHVATATPGHCFGAAQPVPARARPRRRLERRRRGGRPRRDRHRVVVRGP
ncbi:MAG TPA: hypothetical protein VJT75_16185 [Thermoleophilaceae bacterium]|nr:hypothetical protein [Thermoleophilaceae bacterium]